MKITDLGPLAGPVVLWGGALGNKGALDALKMRVDAMDGAHVICTGDLAGYCADGAACVDFVRHQDWPVVAGNVERQLAAGAGSCGCGFEAESTCDRLSRGWWAHAERSIGERARVWMSALPDVIVFSFEERRHAVIHGGVTDISRFLWPVSRQPEFAAEVAALEREVGPIDTIIAGHCGIAFQRVVAGRRWVNAGVIGMPPNGGAAGGRYVVLDRGGAHIRQLRYDPTEVVDAMVAAGLTQGYEVALVTGVWPSQEVLPFEMRRSDGPAVRGAPYVIVD